MFFRIRDFDNGDVVIPFCTESNGTKLSIDSKGMYFDFYTDTLALGRVYVFDFLVKDSGFDQIFTNVAAKFRIDK